MYQLQGNITGYWPYKSGLSAAQSRMEGGTKDRKGRPISTLEMFLQGIGDYVSVAGDWTIWPDGQRIILSAWPSVIFRVVDTGGNFYGSKKQYRVQGHEPFDVAVGGSDTPVVRVQTVTIAEGDSFDGSSVQFAKLDGYGVPYGQGSDVNFDNGEGDLLASLDSYFPTGGTAEAEDTSQASGPAIPTLAIGAAVALAIIVASS